MQGPDYDFKRVVGFKSVLPNPNSRESRVEYSQVLCANKGDTGLYIALPEVEFDTPLSLEQIKRLGARGCMIIDSQDFQYRSIRRLHLPEASREDRDAPRRVFAMLAHAAFIGVVKRGDGDIVLVQSIVKATDSREVHEIYNRNTEGIETSANNGETRVIETPAKGLVGYSAAIFHETNTSINP